MLCEKYKPTLIEAAITGADLPPVVRAHADSCAHCAAELTQQRQLLAAIDANLHRQMNAPVPASMLHRLETRIMQEPQSLPSRWSGFSWLYVCAAFASAAILILFAMPKLHTHKKTDLQILALSHAAPSHTAPSTADHRPQTIPAPLKPAVRRETRKFEHHSQAVTASQPEILVPPDEQIALDSYVARGNARRAFVVALSMPVQKGFEPSFKGLEIPDIDTSEIVIQPIATESRR